MDKFKVGDKVRVIKSAWKNAEERHGKEGIVTRIMRNNAVTVKLGTDTTNWFYSTSCLELITEEPSKPTIIKLPNNHKIVINKPYTIYTDGKVTGKAKCNPEDEWNTEVGIQVAIVRYKTNRQLEDLLESVKPLSSYINPLNLQPKTIQERFPIGSKVEMVKKSGNPWTTYEIGTVATVTGYSHFREIETVYCDYDEYHQVINPDDLRLING